jgi:hypothetical protein
MLLFLTLGIVVCLLGEDYSLLTTDSLQVFKSAYCRCLSATQVRPENLRMIEEYLRKGQVNLELFSQPYSKVKEPYSHENSHYSQFRGTKLV